MASKVLYQDDLEVGQTSTAGTVGEATLVRHICAQYSLLHLPLPIFSFRIVVLSIWSVNP